MFIPGRASYHAMIDASFFAVWPGMGYVHTKFVLDSTKFSTNFMQNVVLTEVDSLQCIYPKPNFCIKICTRGPNYCHWI